MCNGIPVANQWRTPVANSNSFICTMNLRCGATRIKIILFFLFSLRPIEYATGDASSSFRSKTYTNGSLPLSVCHWGVEYATGAGASRVAGRARRVGAAGSPEAPGASPGGGCRDARALGSDLVLGQWLTDCAVAFQWRTSGELQWPTQIQFFYNESALRRDAY